MKSKSFFKDRQNVSDEFLRNEYRTNRMVALFLIGYLIIAVINAILLYVEDNPKTLNIFVNVFGPINIMLSIIILIAWRYHFEKPWIKYMFLASIIAASEISFLTMTTYAMYMVFLPIFISTRYFNKRTIVFVSVITAALFVVSCILNVILEPVSELFALLHRDATYNLWQSPIEAISYYMTPTLVTMIFMAIFGVSITQSGNALIASKIKKDRIIARVDAEINMAAKIQKSVLPEPNFVSPDGNFDLFAYESPAKEVCGDFYDYFMLNDDVLAVIVADVSDKGIPAAMFMMSAKKVLQSALLSKGSLEDAITLANRLICNDNQSDMFLTLWMGLIDTKSGVGKYINAGHPYPVIRHGNGTIAFVDNDPDLFIGNFPEYTPRVHTFRMKPEDTVIIYTDGLTDATDKNGNSFTMERVLQKINNSREGAKNIVEDVAGAVDDFSCGNSNFDDITIFALKCSHIEEPAEIHITEKAGASATLKINDALMETLMSAGCPDDKRRSIGVAVDEICNNISQYAYTDGEGTIDFTALVYDNCVEITFADSGTPFNPLMHDNVPTGTLQIGGFGIYFVKQLSDGISYEYSDNQNRLKLLFVWKI